MSAPCRVRRGKGYEACDEAVSLCCTFPEVAFGGRYPLFLPCGARTFLMKAPFGAVTRLSVPVATNIVLYFPPLVKRIAKFLFRGYNIHVLRRESAGKEGLACDTP